MEVKPKIKFTICSLVLAFCALTTLSTIAFAQPLSAKEEAETRSQVKKQNELASKQAKMRARAKAEKKPELCDYAGTLRDLCYTDIAIEWQQAEICDKILKNKVAESFGENVIGATSSNHLAYQRAHCLRNYAIELSQPVICTKIKLNDVRIRCISESQGRRGDPQLCVKFQNTELKGTCWLNAAIKYLNWEYCDKEESPQCPLCRDQCVFMVAKKARDRRVCKNIQHQYLQNLCQKQIEQIQAEQKKSKEVEESTRHHK